MSNQIFPFGEPLQTSQQTDFVADLTVTKAYPGLILNPNEPNGVYTVFREVSGCSWWAINADFNITTLRWEQNSPQNAAAPAYGIEQCADGTVSRFVADPTNVPGTPLIWILEYRIDPKGNMIYTTRVNILATEVASSLQPTWNGGTAVVMSAREIRVTDTSSAASSALDSMYVNGTLVWQVRKDGTLVVGKVPFANITGFMIPAGTVLESPIIHNGTFTGTSTFNGPVIMTNGLTVSGGETVDSLHVTGNEQVDGNLNVNGNETISGNLTVAGSVSAGSFTTAGGNAKELLPYYTTAAVFVPAPNTPPPNTTFQVGIDGTGADLVVNGVVTMSTPDSSACFNGRVVAVGVNTVTIQPSYFLTGGSQTFPTGSKIVLGGGINRLSSLDNTVQIFRVLDTVNLAVSQVPVVGGGIQAVAGGPATTNVTLALPAQGSGPIVNYSVSSEVFIDTGGADSAYITSSGSSTDTSGMAFNGGVESRSVGNNATIIDIFSFGTAKSGDTLTVQVSTGHNARFMRILATRTS